LSTEKIDLDMVWKRIMSHIGNNFPKKKLRNRLLNLGLEEFVGVGGVSRFSAVVKYGFPFKFNNQLDEGILVLAHFLDRFKKEGGSLEIYAINKLSKGQEKDLSFWQDAKARLYLELQNIILLLDKTEFARPKMPKGEKPLLRRSRIRRIFTFGDLLDLAFLSQAGINVLGEQLAANIDVGFLFLKTFAGTSNIKPLTNTLIVNYLPEKPTPRRHNFFELYGFTDNAVRYDLPYKERCSARWFTRSEQRKELQQKDSRLKQIVNLFTDDPDKFHEEPKKWESNLENPRAVCNFERLSDEFFNDAMLMMFKAYRSEIIKDNDKAKVIIDRINRTVITRDMIRLQRAMSSFGDATEIKAVDATSTKNSLDVHEASPVYRDWLRRSLNRVLRSKRKTLHRIYILDDDEKDQDRDIEYQTLLRLMQFYRDYFHYEVSGMKEIVERHAVATQSSNTRKTVNRKWFKDRWETFSNRVGVFVTTTTVIEAFAEEVLRAAEYPAGFELLYREHVEDGKKNSTRVTYYTELSKLDYLYARYEKRQPQGVKASRNREEKMIYNFLNPRADTNELRFPAFTYRDSLSTEDEKNRLLGFEKEGLGTFGAVQDQHRVNLLAVSLLQYADTYWDILEGVLNEKSHSDLLTTLREERDGSQEGNVTVGLVDKILDARGAFEKRLYDYFKPHFDYLYSALECMSVKVDFWKNIDASSVSEIPPFQDCETKNDDGELTVKGFTDWVMGQVRTRLDDRPHEIPEPEKYGLTTRRKSTAITTAAKTFPYNVFISYKFVRPIKKWVADELYRCLRAAGVRVLWDKKDFKPGKHSITEMQRGVEQSSHMLSVVTPEYFREGAAGLELKMAQQLAIEGKEESLILMVLRETEIPLSVRGAVIINWTDPEDYAEEWRKLLIALDATNKNAPPPGPLREK
jgi:hypothetical protein